MDERLQTLTSDELRDCLHGIEKECLRVNTGGSIAETPHPAFFGSPMTNPYVSTDFSEAQLELVTKPYHNPKSLFTFLENLHRMLYRELGDEVLWPFSAPCPLPDESKIPIAKFGPSNLGQEKELYRKGLSYRYGRKMQSLSGVHYNFSLGKSLLQGRDPSEVYLGITRNFLRYGWLTTYLFGASPALDRSFFGQIPPELKQKGETVYGEWATSLRMSRFGYYSKVQTQSRVSFNTLDEYIQGLEQALNQKAPQFAKIEKGNQINDNVLQLEAEHYSRVRPKPKFLPGMRHLEAVKKNGIEYVEVRAMDLNPATPLGIEYHQFLFLHVFLLYCALKESPPLTWQEEKNLSYNQDIVSLYGRKPGLLLKEKPLQEWSLQILEDLVKIAEKMGGDYGSAVARQRAKILDPTLTPSAKILEEPSFAEIGMEIANCYKAKYLRKKVPGRFEEFMQKEAALSLQKKEEMEWRDDFGYPPYADCEISTQVLLKEAVRRGVKIEELDRKANFFRLSRDGITQDVEKGTMTELDSLISYFKMENKSVSKLLLEKVGIRVPKGGVYYTPEEALKAYPSSVRLVVKPNRSNYGIGIHFVEPNDPKGYEIALKAAFLHGQELIVEEHIQGREFRILVIGDRVSAVCERVPANLTGDGKHTIRELIKIKNTDPRRHKTKKYCVKLGSVERETLKTLGLTPSSVLEDGRQILLRENTNVSTGGDAIDVTDEIHPGYKEIGLQAAKAADATFCGVDMIIKDLKQPPTHQNYGIIEINFNPALWMHRYPTYGAKRYVERDTLDVLGFPE